MTCKNDSNAIFGDGLCAECYVRDAWRDVRCIESNAGLGFVVEAEMGSTSGASNWVVIGADEIYSDVAWQSAAEYTRTRKQEAKEIENEIEVVEFAINALHGKNDKEALRRVLVRERELLDSKRKGMR